MGSDSHPKFTPTAVKIKAATNAFGEHPLFVPTLACINWNATNCLELLRREIYGSCQHTHEGRGAKGVAESPRHGVVLQGGEMQGMKSLEEVAIEYGVTKRTVRNWISRGLVVAYRRNNQAIYIDELSLDRVLSPIHGGRR